MSRASTLLALPLLAGCVDGAQVDSGVFETDSAGVHVVESGVPKHADFQWRVASEPSVSIGSAEGEEGQLLYRVFSARTLPDSSILVSNSGTYELRVYDEDGRLLRSFGGPGEGPGEFGMISSMRILGTTEDSVSVADRGNNRILIFGLDGGFGRAVYPSVIDGYGTPSLMARFDSGEWLGFMPIGTGVLNGEPGDLIDTDFAFLRFDTLASSATQITQVTHRPRVVNSLGGGARHFPYVPLTPEPVYVAGASDLWVVPDGDAELRGFDLDGTLTHIFRWGAPRIEVASIWDRFSEDYLDNVSEDRRAAYARLLANDRVPVPEWVPAADAVVLDDSGHFWVERYRLPWTVEPTWDVISPSGEWLGTLSIPEGVTVLEIGEGHVLGRHRDDLGVERIGVYPLKR